MSHDKQIVPLEPDSLALAMVALSDAPIVLLDREFGVVAASASFARAFLLDPASIVGVSIYDLGVHEWDAPQLRSLLQRALVAEATADASEMDLIRPGLAPRRLVINAHRLDHDGPSNARLLLTVSDVTDARLTERLRDDLMREKSVLKHIDAVGASGVVGLGQGLPP